MVLNCCKYVHYRDELESHAELCWVLSSMIWQQFSFFVLSSYADIYISDSLNLTRNPFGTFPWLINIFAVYQDFKLSL